VTLWQGDAQFGTLQLEDWVTDLAFSPDGSVLAATRQDGIMTLWDMRDPNTPEMSVALVAADGAINALAFSPDGARLATAAEDGSVRLWQVQ
jgi:WD40 repeat protein